MKNKIRTIIIGTPDFGISTFETLINDDHFEIVAAITQPDKKIGRKQIVAPPPVKILAQKYNIPVYQPTLIKNYQLPITDIDLILVIAYAQIIPKKILDLPKFGCINVHASLLPKYRGASCIQAAILNGDSETGITIMKMDEGLDTGPILYQKKIKINDSDDAGLLFEKLSQLSSKIITKILLNYIEGKIKTIPQKNDQSSYVGLLKKDDGKINWENSAALIEKFVRAMSPWPGSFFLSQGKNIKLLSTENKILPINKYSPGDIFLEKDKLCIQCKKDALIVTKIQIEGKKPMTAKEFINGYSRLINKQHK